MLHVLQARYYVAIVFYISAWYYEDQASHYHERNDV